MSRGLAVSPDGRHIFFASARAGQSNIWRVDADGTNLKRLTEGDGDLYPDCTPDGRMIAYHYVDSGPESSRWRIGVVSSEGGAPSKQFDLPPTLTRRFVRWSPDGRTIAFANNPGGLSDVWLQPLDGGPPKQLTNSKAEQIVAFEWSRDGRSLALVRGSKTGDVVIISNATLK